MSRIKEIKNQMQTVFINKTGKTPGVIVQALMYAFATVVDDLYKSLDYYEKQITPITADDNWKEMHFGNLIKKELPDYGQGNVIFFGTIDTDIPVGTKIRDEETIYTTTSEGVIYKEVIQATASVSEGLVTLPANSEITSCTAFVNEEEVTITSNFNGITFLSDEVSDEENIELVIYKSDSVAVVSEEVGADTNRAFDSVLNTDEIITGIDNTVRVLSIEGGKDAEGSASFNARGERLLTRRGGAFSINHIQDTLLEGIPSLKGVWVEDGSVEANTISLFVLNKSNGLTDYEKSEITRLIDTIKPVSLAYFVVPIAKPSVEVIDVQIKDLKPTTDEVKAEVTKNITYLFATKDLYTYGITKEELTSTIFTTSFLEQKVESFILERGWVDQKYRTFFTLGTISYV